MSPQPVRNVAVRHELVSPPHSEASMRVYCILGESPVRVTVVSVTTCSVEPSRTNHEVADPNSEKEKVTVFEPIESNVGELGRWQSGM